MRLSGNRPLGKERNKQKTSFPDTGLTYDQLVTNADALRLGYERLVIFFSLSLLTKAVQSDNLQTALPASSANLSG